MNMRIFCRYDGVDYNDWTVYFKWSNRNLEHYKDRPIVAFQTSLTDAVFGENGTIHWNQFVPPTGSEIYVAPGCPVGMADIRKNYVIKRQPDFGCCNVFSPINNILGYIDNKDFAVVPSRKAIVLSGDRWTSATSSDIKKEVNFFFPDLAIDELDQVKYYMDARLGLRYAEIPESYLSYLSGTLQKPCISYKNLVFKTDNEVNTDILYLVYKTGIVKGCSGSEAMRTFHLQLCALNEHNWRDYPGTLSILMHDMLQCNTPKSNGKCAADLTSPSHLPKAIKEMCKTGSVAEAPFKSQKDIEMAQKFILYVIGLQDMQFTTIQDVAKAFNENRINMNCFYRTFDNIVKFRPKEFKNEEN